MKNLIFFIVLLSLCLAFTSSSFAQTEVTYPAIPGAPSPSEFMLEGSIKDGAFPIFMTYLFYLLFGASFLIIIGSTIYAGITYTISKEDPGKKKKSKTIIISAIQGSLIVLFSYALLFAINSRFVIFDIRDAQEVAIFESDPYMLWDTTDVFFQIPFGLLVEDAILNETAKNKLYDVLEATEKAEKTADIIETESKNLLALVKRCPEGKICCGEMIAANVEDMIENYPFVDGGLYSWAEIQKQIEDDPEFFDMWKDSIEKVTGQEMTKEKIDELVELEKTDDLNITIPAGTSIISAYKDEFGELRYYMGVTEEDIFALTNPTSRLSKQVGIKLVPGCGAQPVYEHDVDFWSKRYKVILDPDYVPDKEELEDEERLGIEKKSGCPPCPIINPPIRAKISEIEEEMSKLDKDLEALLMTKNPLKKDLYQLYKVAMLKTLGKQHVFNYPSLLLRKRHHDKDDVLIETDKEKSEIGPYTWDWSRWVNNIIYTVEVDGEEMQENDPATFYLGKPKANQIIDDALNLAKEAKERGIQDIGKNIREPERSQSSLIEKIISSTLNILPSRFPIKTVFAMTEEEKFKLYLEKEDITITDFFNLSEEEQERILEEENIDISQIIIRSAGDYLTCGMEIPVGETFDLTWNHLIELLDTIDEYIEEGKMLIEQQARMNSLSAPCECPCKGENSCSFHSEDQGKCGSCELSCDLSKIIEAHENVLAGRERMREIAERIRTLTSGHFNTKTQDICNPLNEDIRTDEEKIICQKDESKLITNHELIVRKLNYSRLELDSCMIHPDDVADVLLGIKSSKLPVFGPLAEERDIRRYTKTKEGGAVVNTSDLNWFCCIDSRDEGN